MFSDENELPFLEQTPSFFFSKATRHSKFTDRQKGLILPSRKKNILSNLNNPFTFISLCITFSNIHPIMKRRA